MRLVDLLHRWGGGILGLILAVLGLTGAILVHKDAWIGLPHASDARIVDPVQLGRMTHLLLQHPNGGESLIYASDSFGLVQLRAGEAGLYATQQGDIVARWTSQWERPELWLFDLHHHLFTGETGENVVGIAGLAAIVFAVTGVILWWKTRRTFRLRLWPARMTGPAIRMHHRDLGIIVAPLLLFAALTGSMMIFRPFAGLILAPLSAPAMLEADLQAPAYPSGPLSADLNWPEIVRTAHDAFPDAQLRVLALPRMVGDPVTIRMKRDAEWLPNGRTVLWFDAATGTLLGKRDALAMKAGTQAFNKVYPLHAGKVGGLAYRLLLTISGLSLFMLGSLAVWSFWFVPRKATGLP